MTSTLSKPDEVIYMIDLDGTGSMHPCSKEDDGAVEYIRCDHIDAQDAKIKALVSLIEANWRGTHWRGVSFESAEEIESALAAAKEPT